ncbi:hypothetical protein OG921_24340 [Aldersonia sp. NBC_00410]|uniref:hypothetical protein n=1 Tax=Aldersonia sp. NBC_00410 TaxID=2975954 RepID=UPI0022517AA6|nr:hypothetical protein [Aldersonia sp. NBC_00410]MCX5044819.1 hypothetical protein [Aldersonia sp. NBC_00410]MCX5046306.1 hypothetical protein [Aldersonia sp. NBC_00410]
MIASDFIRVRFGSSGPARRRVEHNLVQLAGGPVQALATHEDVIERLQPVTSALTPSETHTDVLPGWTTERVTGVARWGANIAELGIPRQSGVASQILDEAAAFNLAVAAFDTLVDERPAHLPEAAQALDPQRLRKRMNGDIRCLSSQTSGTSARSVVALFDHVLGSLAFRLADAPSDRAALAVLLERMYLSEMGIGSPLIAKRLPTIFIGRLANTSDDRHVSRVFEALARFFAAWDDYVDLSRDWMSFHANEFLWSSNTSPMFPRLSAAALGMMRLSFARRSRSSIERGLVLHAQHALRAARQCGREREVRALIRGLTQGSQ